MDNSRIGATQTQELLLASARLACEGKDSLGGNGLSGFDGDWADLLRQAEAEGMGGLLYHQLKEAGPAAALPASVRSVLKKAYLHNLLDYQVKVKAIEELLEALTPVKVPVMLLQGMAILERLYPSAGMRPLSDIDLLIRREDLPAVERVLTRLRYAVLSRYPPVYWRDGVRFDLHVEIAYLSRVEPGFNPLRIEDAPLWSAAIPWRDGSSAMIFCPADQIILLSAHLQKHSFGRLIWFVDIGRLLHQYPPEGQWDLLFERASRLHLEKPLYFVLSYLKEVLRLSILEAAFPLMPPPLNGMERKFYSLLLKNRRTEGMGEFLYLVAIGQPIAQLRFLVKIVFPPKKVMREITRSSSFWRILLGYLGRLSHLFYLAVCFSMRLFRKSIPG